MRYLASDHSWSSAVVSFILEEYGKDFYAKAFGQNYYCFDLHIFSSVDFGLI